MPDSAAASYTGANTGANTGPMPHAPACPAERVPALGTPSAGAAMSMEDRRRLLAVPRIGPGVVSSLEAVGITSIQQIVQIGAEQVVKRVSSAQGSPAFGNRLNAIRALLAAIAACDSAPVGTVSAVEK